MDDSVLGDLTMSSVLNAVMCGDLRRGMMSLRMNSEVPSSTAPLAVSLDPFSTVIDTYAHPPRLTTSVYHPVRHKALVPYYLPLRVSYNLAGARGRIPEFKTPQQLEL